MDRIDRRTFLATGIKTGAALAVIGGAAGVVVDAAGPASATDAGNGPPGRPRHLTVVGLTGPVGVDPDDVQFAWHVVDSRRGAVQIRLPGGGLRTGRIGVDGVGQRPGGRRPQQAFVGYGGPPLSADARYRWTVSTADAAGPLEPTQRSGLLHHRSADRGLDRPVAAPRPGRPRGRAVHLPPGRPARCRTGPSPGPPPTWPPPTSTSCG